MITMTQNELNIRVIEELEGIKKLFRTKQEQYRTEEDALENFTRGASLMGYDGELMSGKFEALKAFMAKHEAFIHSHGLYSNKVDESLRDIIAYCAIALAMRGGKDD